MSLIRYQMIYPDCLFRAVINSRNVAPPEDKWAEGALCADPNGVFYIINRKAGEGVYSLPEIETDTLGLSSCFLDGNKQEIFEGDIIEASVFIPPEGMNEAEPENAPAPSLSDFPPYFGADFDNNEQFGEQAEEKEREIFADVPEGAKISSEIRGVVFMSGGMFFIQFFDEENNVLSAVPLYNYFFYDMLPAPFTAVKVVGNLYDDEDTYSEVLHLNTCSADMQQG